jgi:hypothetical protein
VVLVQGERNANVAVREAENQKNAVGVNGGQVVRNEIKKAQGNKFGDFVDIICHNCGTPGHHKASCKKSKVCFICKSENHLVEVCPVKGKGHKSAQYLGSTTGGLGFYNIVVP